MGQITNSPEPPDPRETGSESFLYTDGTGRPEALIFGRMISKRVIDKRINYVRHEVVVFPIL